MKILIVEDSEPVRRMVKSFIGDLVEEFVECRDGNQALDAYTQQHPDLVLMDIQMSQMVGSFSIDQALQSLQQGGGNN